VLPPSAIGVIVAVLGGLLLFGALALGALVASRHRTSGRVIAQIAVIIVLAESFVIALALAVLNAVRGGSDSVTAGLLWYAGGGWALVQIVIIAWIAWVWWRRRRR
jgi:hypothetical protein